jgi:hypothetical protein
MPLTESMFALCTVFGDFRFLIFCALFLVSMWLLKAAPLLIEDFLTLNLLAALLTVFIFGIGFSLQILNPSFQTDFKDEIISNEVLKFIILRAV